MLSKGTDPQIVMEPSQDSVLPRPTPSSKPNIKAQDVMKQYKARISAQSDDKAVSSSATNEVNEAEVISSPPTPFDIIPKPKFSDE